MPEPPRPASEPQLTAEGRALRQLARSLLDPSEVDDVLQDAAVAALQPARARAHGPWLRGLVRNLALLRRRSQARRRAREFAVARPLADAASDPAAVAMQTELMRDVAAAVHDLAEPYRTVVALRFWQGLLPEAIAAQLDVPRNTVRTRLQRGLAMLRAQLDAKYGKRERWAAPLGALVGVRAAAPAAAGSVLFVGMLMNGKLLLGAAAVLVAAAAIPWSLAGGAGDPAARAESATPLAVAAAKEPTPAANERVALAVPGPAADAGPAADEGPFDPSPVHVPPWSPDLLVVDEDDEPVAGATILVFASTKVERSPDVRKRYGGTRHSYSGHAAAPCQQTETDANGRARPVLDLESYCFAAQKEGVGRSPEAQCWHARTNELKLALVRPLTVRGRVLRADGLPTGSALVYAGTSGSLSSHFRPEPVVSDADGRFELVLQGRGEWQLHGSLDGESSFPTRLKTGTSPIPEVEIVFPGAYTIAGTVVDAEGTPVRDAKVQVWREYHLHQPGQDLGDSENRQDSTDAAGHFQIAVERCARYQIMAAADGETPSGLQWVETTAARPHAEIRIALQRFAVIAGRVVRADGSGFAGVRVGASAESGEEARYSAVPCRDDLYPAPKLTTTAADGSFALRVTPGTTWCVQAWPVPGNGQLQVRSAGVEPGHKDLLVHVTEEDMTGCVVRGTIVSGIDGTPVERQNVQLVTYDDADHVKSVGGGGAKVEGNRFVLQPLPLGRRFGLEVSQGLQGLLSGPLAPAFVGPFITTRKDIELVVRLEAWGELPLRVLAADGSVPRNVSVGSDSERMLGVGYPMLHLDAEGRALLQRRNPGKHHLRIVAGGHRLLLEQDVTIQPGRNQELVLHLPATTAK